MDIFSHGLWGGAALGRRNRNFCNMTHSLLIFFIIFSAIWVVRGIPFYPLLAWAFHIIIDIPTHSLELFPTPFLWPVSDFRFDGIGWDSAIVMIPNILMLGTV